MRRVIMLLLVLCFLSSPLYADDWSKVFEQVSEKHLVVIELEPKIKPEHGEGEEPQRKPNCSGVVVEAGLVLAAAHCFVDESGNIYLGTIKGKSTTIARVSGTHDLILLHGDTKKKSPIIVPFTGPKPGQQVAGVGLSYGDDHPSISPQHVLGYEQGYLISSGAFWGGYSGGPLVTYDGYLAGIMVKTHRAQHYSLSIPINAVRTFLDEYANSQTTRQEGLRRGIISDPLR